MMCLADHGVREVHVDGDVGGVEDGDGVEDDGVDSSPLLEDHDGQAEDERVPDLLLSQRSEEWQGRAAKLKHRIKKT